MVNVGLKNTTVRAARARCFVELPDIVFEKLQEKNFAMISKKGPVISTSIIAGVMAAKKTSDLIPFCHQVPLDGCDISIEFDTCRHQSLRIECIVSTTSKTGVEMEALVGVSNAALCVYDMCKGLSHDIKITDTCLVSKSGGKRDFERQEK
jgi:cyclic pyranopterin monophosphate synthase